LSFVVFAFWGKWEVAKGTGIGFGIGFIVAVIAFFLAFAFWS
jgi:hypothetical protein